MQGIGQIPWVLESEVSENQSRSENDVCQALYGVRYRFFGDAQFQQ